MRDKSALRRHYRRLRAQRTPESRALAGRRLLATVLDYPLFQQATIVAAYASFRDEIPTDRLIDALRQAGQRVLLPRVADRGNSMLLCDFGSLDALPTDRFGIRTPDGDPFIGPIDIIFVPGLAFGRDGARLGYGGGFYDRLAASPELGASVRCGLGFDDAIADSLPHAPHDLRLTHIATPTQVVTCTPRAPADDRADGDEP